MIEIAAPRLNKTTKAFNRARKGAPTGIVVVSPLRLDYRTSQAKSALIISLRSAMILRTLESAAEVRQSTLFKKPTLVNRYHLKGHVYILS